MLTVVYMQSYYASNVITNIIIINQNLALLVSIVSAKLLFTLDSDYKNIYLDN